MIGNRSGYMITVHLSDEVKVPEEIARELKEILMYLISEEGEDMIRK